MHCPDENGPTSLYGPDRSETMSDLCWYGEKAECELCEEEKRCFERVSIMVCETCTIRFLPRERLG